MPKLKQTKRLTHQLWKSKTYVTLFAFNHKKKKKSSLIPSKICCIDSSLLLKILLFLSFFSIPTKHKKNKLNIK